MLAIVRLRSSIKMNKDIDDTLKILKLNRINTMRVLPNNKDSISMIIKIEQFVAWGPVSKEILDKLDNKQVVRLKPPKGGLKALKKYYPQGNLGNNGEAINDLIKKMM